MGVLFTRVPFVVQSSPELHWEIARFLGGLTGGGWAFEL